MMVSFTRAGVLLKLLGRLCLRHRLANSCCVLNICNSYCLRVLYLVSAANFVGTMVIDCAYIYNRT